MGDTDDRNLNEDWERQRRFLKEAHGLSDEEIRQLKQEYEDLGDLLDDVVEYGDRAEKLVDDIDEGSDRNSGETESVESGSDQWERLEAWDLDVTTVDGREVVEAHQIDRRLRSLEGQIGEANEQVERINEILDARTEAESGFDIDVEEEQKNIEEQWDRINDAKERIGLSTSDDPSSDPDET